MDEAQENIPLTRAMRTSYHLLAARARSERELRERLREKGYDEAVVADVVKRLRHQGYLDDGEFARHWARHLAVSCLYGDLRIEAQLREKGIPPRLIRDALARAREELTEHQALRKLVQRQLGGRRLAEIEIREKKRLFLRLQAKGFSRRAIMALLGRSGEESAYGNDGQ